MDTSIPVKKLVFNPSGGSGVNTIAFVDQPAIMVNWIAFNEQKPIKFSIQDEERRIIFSPVLIPDLPIPRIDPVTQKPFAVMMDRETIFQVMLDWQKNGRQNFANEMHDGKPIDGITWFNMMVTDEMMFDKAPGFESLPVGTLFTAGKVMNDQVWQKIKSGEYKGISIEGFFDMLDLNPVPVDQIEAMVYEALFD